MQPEAQIGKKLRSFPTKGKKKSEIVQLEDYEGKKARVEGGRIEKGLVSLKFWWCVGNWIQRHYTRQSKIKKFDDVEIINCSFQNIYLYS